VAVGGLSCTQADPSPFNVLACEDRAVVLIDRKSSGWCTRDFQYTSVPLRGVMRTEWRYPTDESHEPFLQEQKINASRQKWWEGSDGKLK
jgi:hypothetical protein